MGNNHKDYEYWHPATFSHNSSCVLATPLGIILDRLFVQAEEDLGVAVVRSSGAHESVHCSRQVAFRVADGIIGNCTVAMMAAAGVDNGLEELHENMLPEVPTQLVAAAVVVKGYCQFRFFASSRRGYYNSAQVNSTEFYDSTLGAMHCTLGCAYRTARMNSYESSALRAAPWRAMSFAVFITEHSSR